MCKTRFMSCKNFISFSQHGNEKQLEIQVAYILKTQSSLFFNDVLLNVLLFRAPHVNLQEYLAYLDGFRFISAKIDTSNTGLSGIRNKNSSL